MHDTRPLSRSLTLVELIVAIGVLALAFAGSMSLYYQTSTFSRSSADRSEARTVGQAQLAALRRTLRSAPLVNGGADNRDQQFTAVLSAVMQGAPIPGQTTYQGPAQNVPLNRGRNTATVVVTAYAGEAAAEAGLGLTAGTLDLDADGTFNGAAPIAFADLWAMPVTVTVTWTTAEGQGATETVTVTGILY